MAHHCSGRISLGLSRHATPSTLFLNTVPALHCIRSNNFVLTTNKHTTYDNKQFPFTFTTQQLLLTLPAVVLDPSPPPPPPPPPPELMLQRQFEIELRSDEQKTRDPYYDGTENRSFPQ